MAGVGGWISGFEAAFSSSMVLPEGGTTLAQVRRMPSLKPRSPGRRQYTSPD
jgi:hypothetical protein